MLLICFSFVLPTSCCRLLIKKKTNSLHKMVFFVFFLKNVVDTLSLAGHHNKREFSIDFYYNSIRISTDFKRNGNQATLKMEVRRISLNQKR